MGSTVLDGGKEAHNSPAHHLKGPEGGMCVGLNSCWCKVKEKNVI